jgi:hypothetical protein
MSILQQASATLDISGLQQKSMPKVPRHVCPTASCAALGVSVLQQSELPPDVSVLQQPLDVFFTTFRSTAVIGQTPPGTVQTAVEQRHQLALGQHKLL